MNNFDQIFSIFKILFIIVPVIVFIMFGFIIAVFVSPKLKAKMMARQMKTIKHMTDYSKKDMEDIGATFGEVSINTKKRVLDKNADTLTDISNMEVNIKKDAIKTAVQAVKEGLADNSIYCKYCGSQIDENSIYCNKCGKKQ